MVDNLAELSLAGLSDALTKSLGLTEPPVAVCFADSAPPGLAGPAKAQAAGCVFWQLGAKEALVTTAADHNLCAIGVHTHNLEGSPGQQADLLAALQVFEDLTYVRSSDVPQIPVLRSRPNFVVYAPLAKSPVAPDVVLVFMNPAQALIFVEAAQQVEGSPVPALGRPACAAVPQTSNTGRAALSFGCCGARAYMDSFTDDTVVGALPGANLARYVERLEALARANETLRRFHQTRRVAVESGETPTVLESLASM